MAQNGDQKNDDGDGGVISTVWREYLENRQHNPRTGLIADLGIFSFLACAVGWGTGLLSFSSAFGLLVANNLLLLLYARWQQRAR